MKLDTQNPNETVSGVVVLSDATFVPEVIEADIPVLVDFMAQWCGPCKRMGPVFADLAPEYSGTVKFAKLDVDANPEVAGALSIESIPTFMLIYRRTILAMGVGAMPPQALRDWLAEGLARMSEIPAEPVATES
jgi:thioredoxin